MFIRLAAKSLRSCPTLRDPIDGSPPGSSAPGILQARILEWVAISFCNACTRAKLLQSCLTLRSHRRQPTKLHPQDSLSKSTGVGCHFLLHHTARLATLSLSRFLIQQPASSYFKFSTTQSYLGISLPLEFWENSVHWLFATNLLFLSFKLI